MENPVNNSAEMNTATKAKILVVEDEFLLAEGLCSMLRDLGYQVLGVAQSETEAEALLETYQPDLVLVDIVLAKTNGGLSLASNLRYQYRIPFVFITSHIQGEILQQAKATQPYGYLTKPIRKQDLYAAVEVAIYKAAYEDVSRQEMEKKLLLDISSAIATIRRKEDLLRIVIEKLKPLLGFHNSSILILDKEKEYYYNLSALNTTVDDSKTNRSLQQSGYDQVAKMVLKGSTLEWIIRQLEQTGKPVVLDFERDYLSHTDNNLLNDIKQRGYKEGLAALLQTGGEVLGCFFIHSVQKDFFQPEQSSLFQGVTDQLSVAVANILANEEILEREREKGILLSISEQLATIRNKHNLFEVIYRKLKPVFGFDDAVIVIYDEKQEETRHLYTNSPEDSMFEADFPFIQTGKLSIKEGPYELFTQLEFPKLFPITFFTDNHPEYIGTQILGQLGIVEVLHMPLRYGGKYIGTFEFHNRTPDKLKHVQMPLFRSLADQMAVAVANILANEEVLEREREKSLQVAVINALTEEGSWEEKLLRLTRVLQNHIPLDYLFLLLEKDKQYGQGHGYLRIGFDEYQYIDTESFFRMTGINQQKYLALRDQRGYTQPELLQGEAFEKAAVKYGMLGLLTRTFKLQSSVAIPLKLSHPGRFLLQVLSRKPHGLTPEHLELLEKVATSLAITLDNLLAYEEIKQLKERLEVEKEYLEDEININYKFEDIVGASQSLKEVFKKVSQVATADSTVLVLGETGTGKELIARAIHNLSRRSDRSLVKINCAALPAQLIESELFGHEKGAFTGALDRRIGKFELAHGSTIFLDEVGELPLELQAKLLRAIQEKEVERLGGNKIVKTDVRIIAATNRNLEKEVAQGRFRSDLYFRLNVFPITLPPLRERKEDIPLLAVHFIRKMAKKIGKNIAGISNAAIKEMQAYNWPGNIRELEHIIERAAITSSGIISELGLPEEESDLVAFPVGGFIQRTLAQSERALIIETLKRCNGRIRGKGGAAELLDIEPNTLDARMKKLGIVKKQVFENGV